MKAKKLVALVLASGHFLSVACRFACAEMMPQHGHQASAMSAAMQACHHHASRDRHGSRGTAPCCMTDPGAPALVNAFVAAPGALRGLCLGEIALAQSVAIRAPARAFCTDSSPPPRSHQAVFLYALSPRAPPSLPVVL